MAPSAIQRHRLSPSSCRLFGKSSPEDPTKRYVACYSARKGFIRGLSASALGRDRFAHLAAVPDAPRALIDPETDARADDDQCDSDQQHREEDEKGRIGVLELVSEHPATGQAKEAADSRDAKDQLADSAVRDRGEEDDAPSQIPRLEHRAEHRD